MDMYRYGVEWPWMIHNKHQFETKFQQRNLFHDFLFSKQKYLITQMKWLGDFINWKTTRQVWAKIDIKQVCALLSLVSKNK